MEEDGGWDGGKGDLSSREENKSIRKQVQVRVCQSSDQSELRLKQLKISDDLPNDTLYRCHSLSSFLNAKSGCSPRR